MSMNEKQPLLQSDIQKIAEQGANIYARIKHQFDPKERGKFLAIDIESQQTYLGETSAEALGLARAEHPTNIFYVVKIGYDVAETMAQSLLQSNPRLQTQNDYA